MTEWPDTEIDRKAFEQAKQELGNGDISALVVRAQQIKTELKERKRI